MADIKDIRTILRDLHLVSGFRVSLHGTDFSEISAYPEEISPFCRLVQENPKAKMQGVYTDADAFERERHSGKIYIYRCRFGLCEAACPLYKNGVLSGYLMMGQVRDGLPGTDAAVISEALPYVSDRPELEKAVSSLPSVPREKMLALADIISLCADRLLCASERARPCRVRRRIHQPQHRKKADRRYHLLRLQLQPLNAHEVLPPRLRGDGERVHHLTPDRHCEGAASVLRASGIGDSLKVRIFRSALFFARVLLPRRSPADGIQKRPFRKVGSTRSAHGWGIRGTAFYFWNVFFLAQLIPQGIYC